jgi:acetate kinase
MPRARSLEGSRHENQRGTGCISAAGSRLQAWVIPTNEELMIARHTASVLEPALA